MALIARNGHVVGCSPDFSQLDRTNGRLEPKLIGTREASTFPGFCASHDTELFKPLEREPFSASNEQIALLGYRAICRELYAKRSAQDLVPTLAEADRGRSIAHQLWWQGIVEERRIGYDAGIRDLERCKAGFAEAINRSDFTAIHGLIVKFSGLPMLLACAPLAPEFDFLGAQIQDLNDLTRAMDGLAMNVIATGTDSGAAVFCWTGDSQPLRQFADSLEALDLVTVADRIVQFCLEHCENVFWSPAWWDDVGADDRKRLLSRINSHVWDAGGPETMLDDGTRVATWRAVEIVRF